MSVLDEVEGKAIIWCHWRHDIENVIKAIITAKDSQRNLLYGPRSVVTYYGDTTSEDRQKAIKRYKIRSEVRFLVGTPQTAGMVSHLQKQIQ